MNQLELSDLIGLGLGCLGAFIFVVVAGGLFIYTRTRKQNQSSVPAPTPPPITVDAHALPVQMNPLPVASVPPPAPLPRPPRAQPAPAPLTPIDEELDTQPHLTRPVPAGVTADADDETNVYGRDDKANTPLTLGLIDLPESDDDADSATIIIDRSSGKTRGEDK